MPVHIVSDIDSKNYMRPKSAERVPVVGFVLRRLDESSEFVLLSSQARCLAASVGLVCDSGSVVGASVADAQAALKLADSVVKDSAFKVSQARSNKAVRTLAFSNDFDNTFAVGVKKVLFMLVLPKDGAESLAAPNGYNFGRIKNEYGGSAKAYWEARASELNDWFKKVSWGSLSIEYTVTSPMKVAYQCVSGDTLVSDDAVGSVNTLQSLAKAAAAQLSPPVVFTGNFDFDVTTSPQCSAFGFGGQGFVGAPGSFVFTYATVGVPFEDLSTTMHELGHNFGADGHDGAMQDSIRGAMPWTNTTMSTSEEYGNPFSALGNILGTSSTDVGLSYLIEGKAVYDWLDDTANFAVVDPFQSGCNPCGPFNLYVTDSGPTRPPTGTILGIRIATYTANRFYFIEHHSVITRGNAAIVTWGDIQSSGRTGSYGQTILLDCKPATTTYSDAPCLPGTSFKVNVGAKDTASREMILTFGAVSSDKTTMAISVYDMAACPAGQYNNNGNSACCTPCASGKYSAATAAVSSTTCIDCAAGKVSATTGSASSTACTDCTSGKFSSTGSSVCATSCPAGAIPLAGTACVDCVAGHFASAGASACAACTTGTYSSVRSTACTTCAAGTFLPVTVPASSCISCEAGKYNDATNSVACFSVTFAGTELALANAVLNNGAYVVLTANITLASSNTYVGGSGVTINGQGMFMIDGQGLYRCLTVNGANATLTRLTIANGNATFGGGVQVFSGGAYLTLSFVTMVGNKASSSGGAVYSNAPLSIVSSSIFGSSAEYGGGIYF